MAEIVLQGIRKTFAGGKVVAVDRVDLEIPDGKFTCLLGASGSGKTTILRIIAGLEVPDAGRVFIGGRDVTRLEPRHRDVAMVFQGYALYPHMTVRENIAYPLRVRGVPPAERERLVREVAARLGIDGLLDRMPGQLSGGQQQRVALARVLVRRPQAALYDEPLAALDARLRAEMRLELRRLQQEFGVTTVMVTHDQLEALSMSDLIAVIHEGRVQQFASPLEIFNEPANMFVAGFVGEPQMNFFTCRYAVVEQRPVLQNSDFSLTLPFAVDVPGPEVVLGIRPQHVVMHFSAGEDRIAGTVLVSEIEGTEALHIVELGRTRIKVKTSADILPRPGQPVWLELPPGRVYFFDPATGRRLLPEGRHPGRPPQEVRDSSPWAS